MHTGLSGVFLIEGCRVREVTTLERLPYRIGYSRLVAALGTWSFNAGSAFNHQVSLVCIILRDYPVSASVTSRLSRVSVS